jgi:hypothetical protein
MKRTEDDEQFGAEFAKQQPTFYDRAIAAGETEKAFARRLGVDRGGLQRYLKRHATPSLRTAVLAFREFGIAIPYAGVENLILGVQKGKETSRDLNIADGSAANHRSSAR